MRKLFRIILAVGIAVALMVVLARSVDLRTQDLEGLVFDPFWALMALLGYFPCVLLRAMRMRHFAPDTYREQGLGKMSAVLVTHQAANHVLPMKLGELVYPLLLRTLGKESVAKGLGATILMRFADLLGLGVVVCIASGVAEGIEPSLARAYGLGGMLSVAIALLLLARGDRVFIFLSGLLGSVTPPFLERITGDLGEALGAMENSALNWALLIAESVLLWGGLVGIHCALGCAFGLCLPPEMMALGALGSVLSGYLPVGSLLNLGTVELGWVATLPLIGVLPTDALIFGTAIHLSLVCLTVAYALFALMILGWIRRGTSR